MVTSPLTPAEYDGKDEDQPLLLPSEGLPHSEYSCCGQCQGAHQEEPVEQRGEHGTQHVGGGGVEGGNGENVQNRRGQAHVDQEHSSGGRAEGTGRDNVNPLLILGIYIVNKQVTCSLPN